MNRGANRAPIGQGLRSSDVKEEPDRLQHRVLPSLHYAPIRTRFQWRRTAPRPDVSECQGWRNEGAVLRSRSQGSRRVKR